MRECRIVLRRGFFGLSGVAMRGQRGFTIIEFLVVAAICGILALIAVPQYSAYRERAYTMATISDVSRVARAQKELFSSSSSYKEISSCSGVSADARCALEGLPGLESLSKGVSMDVKTSQSGFIVTAKHIKSAKICSWDSSKGGPVECSS